MNVNEVLANRASQLLGGTLGTQEPVAPNDDVNMGQSSNDSFPTAMHIAAIAQLDDHLLPQTRELATAVEAKANQWEKVVKIGRTHLEDAVPLTVGQEWSGSPPSYGRVSTTSSTAAADCSNWHWAAPRWVPG